MSLCLLYTYTYRLRQFLNLRQFSNRIFNNVPFYFSNHDMYIKKEYYYIYDSGIKSTVSLDIIFIFQERRLSNNIKFMKVL